jgi:hypothetical protein
LSPESVDAIARRVVDLLRDDLPARLLTPLEVAQRLGRSRAWVYAHRDDLGARRRETARDGSGRARGRVSGSRWRL